MKLRMLYDNIHASVLVVPGFYTEVLPTVKGSKELQAAVWVTSVELIVMQLLQTSSMFSSSTVSNPFIGATAIFMLEFH